MTKKPTATPAAIPTESEVAAVADIVNFLSAASQPEPQPENSDNFWNSDNPKIKIRTQPGIAMSFSSSGDFFIRQHGVSADNWIVVTRANQQQFLEDVGAAMGIKLLWNPKKNNEEKN